MSMDIISELNPISLNDSSVFRNLINKTSSPISHYSFSVMYAYADLLQIRWMSCHNHICVFMIDNDFLHLFIPPLPEAEATIYDLQKALLYCFKRMNAFNAEKGNKFAGKINAVSDEQLARIADCTIAGLEIRPYSSGKDYVYDIDKIITLAGSALASKRQSKNKFMRDYPNHYIDSMSDAYIPDCLNLLKKWDKAKRDFQTPEERNYQQDEFQACERIIKNWRSPGLKGMVLFADEKLIGFTFGTYLTPKQALILIEKTDPDFKNASAFIFSEFCKHYWSDCTECNCDDDGNNANLQLAKTLYRPKCLLNKSSIIQTRDLSITT
ncbi:MAG: phosphatidylglycerol lysyltransferase domain-containing protein [Gammaproteobacteria bacterium]|nr:phosphatidylglycerol lysyltransferase domain-containing protein [Gammaproteobacteria bacterium]